MPDETPFLILLVAFGIVMVVLAFGVIGEDDPQPPIKPATQGTISPAGEC